MAVVPTFETLLIEIRKSFGLPLTKDRSKFIHVKSSEGVHKSLFNELKDDLIKHLGLSEKDTFAFDSQVRNWSVMSLKLSQSLWVGPSSQKQLLWLLATHIYIPSIARLAAYWQSDEIMDKGMPAHLFWYLPEEINGELHLPMTQVWNWLEDLIFDPSNTLEDQIFGHENADSKSIRLGVTRESFKRTLSNWKGATGKESAKLIEDYFSGDLHIGFKGTFNYNEIETLNENFERAVSLVKEKGHTSKTLYLEIQIENEETIEKILEGECSDDLKQRFLNLIISRFSEPSNQVVIRFFSMAQAFQNAYVRFGRLIDDNEFNATSRDPKKNRLVQLIAIFKYIYNIAYQTSKDVNPECRQELFFNEDREFDEKIPDQLEITLFQALCGKGRYEGLERSLANLNSLLANLEPNIILDVIGFAGNSTSEWSLHSDYFSGVQNYIIGRDEFEVYKCTHSINELISKIQKEESPKLLVSIGCKRSFNQSVRQSAFHRLDEMMLSPRIRLDQYTGQLAVLLNNETKFDRPSYSEELVASILEKAKGIEGYENILSDFVQFEAKHELSKGNIDKADSLFKKALGMPSKMTVASNRGEIARDLFALRAFNQKNGYSLKNQEQFYRDMKYFGGFDPGKNIEPLLGLYWMDENSTFNINDFFPPIEFQESALIEYYPELFELYPAYQ
jgi:hypothetical protein